MAMSTDFMNRQQDANTQAFLQAILLDWLPSKVVADIKRVHVERRFDMLFDQMKVEFKNGLVSIALEVEETGRSLVNPLRVLDENQFSHWQADCCMKSGNLDGIAA